MSVHPMDYLRSEFLEPMGVTQEVLQERLELSHKTLSDLYRHKRGFTVTTAKKFGNLVGMEPERLLQMQVRYDLAVDKAQFHVKPLEVPENTRNIQILLNQSLERRITLKMLRDLFREHHFKEQPALVTALFEDVPLNKTVKYMLDMGIGLGHLKKMYEFYRTKLDGRVHPHVERLLMDDDRKALHKMLDNGCYFKDARDFEQYAFYRLAFMHKKRELLKWAMDGKQSHEARQRAAYLYSFVTGETVDLGFTPRSVKLYANSKKPAGDANEYGLVSGLDKKRFEQFVTTGNY